MTDPKPQRASKKGRSPSYPAVALDVAVDRARVLYEREKQHLMPLSAVMDHWGYAQKSGLGIVTIAALKKFGLIGYQGSGSDRGVQLTGLALDILLKPDPLSALQQAALTPSIHKELWDSYGSDLPSDATLRYELIRQRGFTEVGADEFIPQWKRTIAVAQLASSANLLPDDELLEPELPSPPATMTPVSDAVEPIKAPAQGTTRTVQLPLLKEWALLQVPFPMSEADWQQLLRVLEAMKPGLVLPPEGDLSPS
jgi:hypothetical protein